MNLKGRTALVTGAARRLGRAMALALAEDGADVLVHYGRSEAEAAELVQTIQALGRRAVAIQADLSCPKEVARLAEATSVFERLDLLVNSASVFEKRAWKSLTEDDWDRQLEVNLHAPFRLIRHLGPKLSQGNGLVVNLVDASAHRPWKGYLAHSVSKAGLVALSKALAREMAPEVRVNAICPGPVLWPERYDETERAAVLRKVPLGRAGDPEDVVRALRYLVAADYVTGEVLSVEGGRLLS